MSKPNILISIDTEFESSNVISGNCLQLAFVAFLEEANPDDNEDWIVDKLSLCFLDQEKQKNDNVMEFWSKFPEIHGRILSEAVDMKNAMLQLQVWLNELHRKYEVIGFLPDISTADFPWFRNLYLEHTDQKLTEFFLPWDCICLSNMMKTLIVLGDNWKDIKTFCTTERYKHTHYALDDAIECSYFYLKLKEYIKLNFRKV